MEFFEQVKQTFKRMDERLTNTEGQLVTLKDVVTEQIGLLQVQVAGLREDLQGVGGAFASIEAMLIAQAAREQTQDEEIKSNKQELAKALERIEALERKAS